MTSESWATSAATRTSMLGNRRRDTKPEVALRSALHAAGLRFRKDLRLDLGSVKPRPDIVFTRAKVAVFVDGCFWHSCPIHGTKPSRNADYWLPKLARNVERDREHDAALVAHGWQAVRIWEHEQPTEAAERVRAILDTQTTALPGSRHGPKERQVPGPVRQNRAVRAIRQGDP